MRSLTLLCCLTPALAFGASPVLHFSDLNWGPKSGWEGSASKGAAVTVWGENLGATRGSSFITVNGAQLSSSSDYAEWGAPDTRGMQRITFWLNPQCADGSGSISVTVNGAASNSLPFTVSPGAIYFVSASDGSNSNNGRFATAQGGGNGPFHDLYMFSFQHNPSGDAQYIMYARAGRYSVQDPNAAGTIISYRGPSGGPTRQKALVGYPAEIPVIDGSNLSHGVVWNADYAPYGRNSYLTYGKLTVQNGSTAFYLYGDNIRVVGNHFQNMLEPVWSGVVFIVNSQNAGVFGNWFDHSGAQVDGSYKHNVYILTRTLSETVTSQNNRVGWNDFSDFDAGADNRGGNVFIRTDSAVSSTIQTQSIYIHDNLFRGGNNNHIEIGDGPPQRDIWIYNNVFTGGQSVNSTISLRWTTANANLFNNTFYLAGSAGISIVDVIGLNPPGSEVHSANNSFYALPGQQFFRVQSGSTMTSDHDLFYRADGTAALPSGAGLTLTNGKVGDPLYVNPAAGDFHLQPGSPAINSAGPLPVVTEDFNGVPRPQGSAYDMGAFEFGSGATSPSIPPPVTVTVTPTSATLSGGQSQPFSAAVSGSANAAVTWSMNPQVGSLSASGVYSAPAPIASQQIVQVTATSTADPTRSVTATVTLIPTATGVPATPVAVSVSPTSVSLSGGDSRQFTVTVSGTTNAAVTWSMNPQVGTLSASGVYTAPASITLQQTLLITAKAVADPTKSATVTVTLNPPVVNPPVAGSTYTVSWRPLNATQIAVSWTAPAGHSKYDAVVLSGYASLNWWYVWQGVTGSESSGSFIVNLPTSPGIYRVRYNSAQTRGITAESSDIAINVAQFSVTPSAPSAAPGTAMKVAFTAPVGRPATWADTVGLYRVGSANDSPVWSQYTIGATSGTFNVPALPGAGVYEFRYVLGYVIGARSAPVSVQ